MTEKKLTFYLNKKIINKLKIVLFRLPIKTDAYRKTESVVSVATETEYLKKIKNLYNLKKQVHPTYTGNTENLIIGGLEFAKAQNYIVSLMLLDSEEYSTTGFVHEIIEDATVVISEVDSFGFVDGKRFIDIEAIEHLTINGEEEQDVKLLFSHNI